MVFCIFLYQEQDAVNAYLVLFDEFHFKGDVIVNILRLALTHILELIVQLYIGAGIMLSFLLAK